LKEIECYRRKTWYLFSRFLYWKALLNYESREVMIKLNKMIACLSISFYEKTCLHYVYKYNILKTFHTIDVMTPKFLLCESLFFIGEQTRDIRFFFCNT
jgi:hypothetical protein